MRLRNLSFTSLSPEGICRLLQLSGFSATITGDHAVVNNWLQTSSFLDTASSALSCFSPPALATLPAGHLWTLLPDTYWSQFSAILRHFSWKQQTDSDIQEAEAFARGVLNGHHSIDETLGDPVLFIATLRYKFGNEGQFAAPLASAFSLLSIIVRCGGQFIWKRFTFNENISFRRLNVTWSNGKYQLNTGWWGRKQAARRTSSHLGEARILRSDLHTNQTEHKHIPVEKDFQETKHVSSVAMWLGVSVREVNLNVLANLLENPGKPIVDYVKAEGFDLADIIALGGETSLHSRQGKVILFNGHVLQYPSLGEVAGSGYFFKCEWGLGRAEQKTSRRKNCYYYLRAHFEQNWCITSNETYFSQRTILRSIENACQYAFFTTQAHLLRRKHAQVNANDAKARLRRKERFVENAEASTAEPLVSTTMLKALSDRIPVHLSDKEVQHSWRKCFGTNEKPAGGHILDDEIVLVLSYRHESRTTRMGLSNWRFCYEDLAEVAASHGKKAMRVWTDKLASNTRGGARWIESGVEPYRNAVVVAFNGPGDSIFVDRFWLSLERNTGLQAWGYWLRNDMGQLMRIGVNEYPARTEDHRFLSQILFTPGRADGPLWEEDRLAVIREAAELLGARNMDTLWDALTLEFLPSKYLPFDIVSQDRGCGKRRMKGVGWSCGADVLVDRELVERAVGFAFEDRTGFEVRKWICGQVDGGNRLVGIKSKVSDHWFCASVQVEEVEGKLQVEDVFGRVVVSTDELEAYTEEFLKCPDEAWM